MPVSVRELPPLRLGWVATALSGKTYRWGDDESEPDNVPSGISFSTTMPGGFEQCELTLPRKPELDYADLDRLATIRAFGMGDEPAWEGRLERAPRQSGDQMAVSPGLVGWQAHLEDDTSAREIYVDRDLSRWGEPSVQERLNVIASSFIASGGSVVPDTETGQPSLATTIIGAWAASSRPSIEPIYESGGIPLGSIYYAWKKNSWINAGDASWAWSVYLTDDDVYTASDSTANLRAAGPGSGTLTATTATRMVAAVTLGYASGPAGGNGDEYSVFWTCLAVYGNHGLTKRGTAPDEGFFASDIVEHAVATWAPLLTTDVEQSGFIIPQAAFLEPTTAGEIVRQSTRFGLQDWAVWDDKTFVWHTRGARGRQWRVRISPSQLQETGSSVENLYESVIVQYQDVDGTAKTVGPDGSGADTESSDLKDDDTENPANQLGIVKRALLQMGISTAAGATEVGRRFLEEQKLANTSGQAQLVGHVEDSHGVKHAAWKVRAGDTIEFVDASDPSPRRIVRTQYDHGTRTMNIDLDAPPEGLKALLERLGADLIMVGL